jgi:hypothetical protein
LSPPNPLRSSYREVTTLRAWALAVVTREVVDTADWWMAAECGVGTVMVVEMDQAGKACVGAACDRDSRR